MKRLVLASLLLLVAFPLLAVNRTVLVVDDVIRMTKASVGDDQIIEFVRNSNAPFEITGDDVIAMNDAKVSPAVMKFVIDESAARMKAARTEPAPQQYDNRAQQGNDPQQIVVQHQYPVYAGPSYPSAYPYYYDPYYAGYPYYGGYYGYGYPYYYGSPYVSFGIGLGYYGYYGGYYGHSHGYYGGHYGYGGHGGHGGGGHGGGGHGGSGHPGHGGGGHGGGGHH